MSFHKPDPADHEAKCERCGISCLAAVEIKDGRQVVIEGLKCVYLGVQGDKPACSVYSTRFDEAPWCLHSKQAARLGALRKGCPYTEGLDVKGKERLSVEEYDALWPEIAEALLGTQDLSVGFTWREFCKVATARDPGHTWRAVFNAPRTRVTVTKERGFWSKLWTKGEI